MEFVRPFNELPFSLTVLGAFLFCFGLFIPFSFIILSAEYNGMSANLAIYLLYVLSNLPSFGNSKSGCELFRTVLRLVDLEICQSYGLSTECCPACSRDVYVEGLLTHIYNRPELS